MAQRSIALAGRQPTIVERESGVFVVRAVVFATTDISAEVLGVLKDAIERDTGMDVRLKTRVLHMDIFDSGAEDAPGGEKTSESSEDAPPPEEPAAEEPVAPAREPPKDDDE